MLATEAVGMTDPYVLGVTCGANPCCENIRVVLHQVQDALLERPRLDGERLVAKPARSLRPRVLAIQEGDIIDGVAQRDKQRA